MSDFPGLRRLLDVMRRLRDPASGCPWDLAQDGRSLARYTLEEAHELVAALESGAPEAVRDELGDLLFQVVFHAQLAMERGEYDFDAIAAGIAEKLARRHPHVFGQTPDDHGGGSDALQWEKIKTAERGARGAHGVLDDVPLSLPALTRATKLGKRAATVGFDWPDAAGARAKVLEELAEVDAAALQSPARVAEEMGDLLLAVVSLARHLRVDPETALRQASQRFEGRFRRMEALAVQRGLSLAGLAPAEWDSLWEEVKRNVQS